MYLGQCIYLAVLSTLSSFIYVQNICKDAQRMGKVIE